MVVLVYEAVPPELLPEKRNIRNGALALLLEKAPERSARLRFTLPQLRALQPAICEAGSVQGTLMLLDALTKASQ